MVKFKNFKTYTPSGQEDLLKIGVGFLMSEEGVDWYECQNQFAKDTLKLVYDQDTKRIISTSYDVSGLFPMNSSVAEVKKFPKKFDPNGDYTDFVFDDDKDTITLKVYTDEELKSQVESKKAGLISEAMTLINPYKFAEDLGIATDDESAKLKALQKYVVDLNRVSQQEGYPTKITWPKIPT